MLHDTSRSSLVMREKNMDAIYTSASSSYLQEARDKLVEAGPSHLLLEADNSNSLLPSGLQRDANVAQFVFVDEPRCIGCHACAEVARSTFRMEEEFGAARVFQQCGDDVDVVEEAILCCPVDCIHEVSFNELRTLEDHRQRMFDDGAMAAAQGAGKIAARAEGRDGAPNWREPLRGMSLDASGLVEPPRTATTEDQQALDASELGWEVLTALQGGEFGEEDDVRSSSSTSSSSASGSVDDYLSEPDAGSAAAFAGPPEAGYGLLGELNQRQHQQSMPAETDVSDALFGGYVEPVLELD